MKQLRLVGDEVELGEEFPVSRNAPGLTGVQREILRLAGAQGWLRSVEAGVIVHRGRPYPCPGPATKGGCCKYASSDGLEACKRLAKRGLLRRTRPGRWEVA